MDRPIGLRSDDFHWFRMICDDFGWFRTCSGHPDPTWNGHGPLWIRIWIGSDRIGSNFDRIGLVLDRLGSDSDRIGSDLDLIGSDLDLIGSDLSRIGIEFGSGCIDKSLKIRWFS